MAAVLSPYRSPAQSILLNPSPSASPYQHPSSLPALLPSNSSLSSSTSSSSHLPSDSDYFSSPPTPASKPASPMAPPQHLHPYSNAKSSSHSRQNESSHPKPKAGAQPSGMRRIRFAPLPEPRREVGYTVTGAEIPLGQIEYEDVNDADEDDLRRPSELALGLSMPFLRSPPGTQSLLIPDNSCAAGHPSSPSQPQSILLHSSPDASSSSALSTPLHAPQALGSTDISSSGEWHILPSEFLKTIPADEEMTPCQSKASSLHSGASSTSKWTKKLFKPLLKGALGLSTDDDSLSRTTSNASTATATTPVSAASETGAEGCLPINSKKAAKSRSRSSSRTREKREPDWIREFGMPLGRWSSDVTHAVTPGAENLSEGGLRRVGQMNVGSALARTQSLTLSEMGGRLEEVAKQRKRDEAAAKAQASVPNGPRRQTRMLNGRVYGAKRNQNLFANIRSEDPEFVEWGYGGMGSVKASGNGAGIWAKVQSTGTSIEGRASKDDDGDDGSGMAWVRKRKEQKEQREREQREEEERRRKEASKEEASGVMTPLSEESAGSTPGGMATPTAEHITTAVNVPAAHHHHHHHHHHPHKRSTSDHAPSTPERRESGDTARGVPIGNGLHVLSPITTVQTAEPEEIDILPSVGKRVRSESIASNTSDSELGSEDSPKDTDNDAEDELELEDDEEIERVTESRRTALGAGVEKISRHKEHEAASPTAEAS